MCPVVPSGKVIWCAKGTEFHCASLPTFFFFFFFHHVIYGEHLLSFWGFLMIVADHDGRVCDQPLKKSLNFESQGILLCENTTHMSPHFTARERWKLRDAFFQIPLMCLFCFLVSLVCISSCGVSQLSQQCPLQMIILCVFFFFLQYPSKFIFVILH